MAGSAPENILGNPSADIIEVHFRPERYERWRLLPEARSATAGPGQLSTFAVVVGKMERYSDPSLAPVVYLADTVVMVVQRHAPDRWHNVGYGLVATKTVQDWDTAEFAVGGPLPI